MVDYSRECKYSEGEKDCCYGDIGTACLVCIGRRCRIFILHILPKMSSCEQREFVSNRHKNEKFSDSIRDGIMVNQGVNVSSIHVINNINTNNPNSGVYMILNKDNDDSYIGRTKDFKKAEYDSFKQLDNNEHKCKSLQRAYSEYGPDNFKFLVLHITDDAKKQLSLQRQAIKDFRATYNMKSLE